MLPSKRQMMHRSKFTGWMFDFPDIMSKLNMGKTFTMHASIYCAKLENENLNISHVVF